MTRGALANIVISSGDACRYGADGNRIDETQSREISQPNASCTMVERDFSTPLRFDRNDERGARQHRHLERIRMPLWGADGNRIDETQSREISQPNASCTMVERDFSTPLRFDRNDERGARQYRHLERGDAPVWVLEGNRFDETLSREISQRNAARTIRGDFSTPLRYGRNDDRARLFFIKSAPEGRHHHPRPEGLSPPERKRRNPSTQPAAPAAPLFLQSAPEGRHHNPRPERPSNLRTLRTFGVKPRQPSRRRRVQSGPIPLTTLSFSPIIVSLWKGVRAVDGGGLENR